MIRKIFNEEEKEGLIKSAGEKIKELHARASEADESLTIRKIVDDIKIDRNTLKNVEEGGTNSRILAYVTLFHYFGGNAGDAAEMLGVGEQRGGLSDVENHVEASLTKASYDNSTHHTSRLEKYTDQSYNIYYVNSDGDVVVLELDMREIVDGYYVKGNGVRGSYGYYAKLVSPPNSGYSFIYLTCKEVLVDRAILIMPYPEQVVRKHVIALGVMMSITIESPRCPCTQMFAMISKEFYQPDAQQPEGKAFLESIREKLILPDKVDGFTYHIPGLEQRSRKFYIEMKRALSKKLRHSGRG